MHEIFSNFILESLFNLLMFSIWLCVNFIKGECILSDETTQILKANRILA